MMSSQELEVLTRAVDNCLRELMQGHGGLNAYIDFARQISLKIPGLEEINRKVYVNYINWQVCLANADAKTVSHKSFGELEDLTLTVLGLKCPLCGLTYPPSTIKCPLCKCRLKEIALPEDYERLLGEGYPVGPRTLLVLKGAEWLLEAYLNAYRGLRLILKYIANLYGAEKYSIGSGDFYVYLEMSRVFLIKGDQRLSLEQRQLLQILAWGCLADAPLEEVEDAFRKGVNVVKYGWLTENVSPQFRFELDKAVAEFVGVYQPLIIKFKERARKSVSETVEPMFEPLEGVYIPAMILSMDQWIRGKIGGKLHLQPYPEIVRYTQVRQESGSINLFFSAMGKGKTLFMRALGQSTVERGGIVLIPVSDDSNQSTLVSVPLVPFSRETKKVSEILEKLQLNPKPLPSITLNIVRPEDFEVLADEPLTIYDRILFVEDINKLSLDFNLIVEELGKVSRSFGYNKPCGYINVRFLGRFEGKTNVELIIGRKVIREFTRWREKNKQQFCRVQIDELAELGGASQIRLGGTSEYMMGGQIVSFLRQSRRKRLEVDASSQRVSEVLNEVREHATNIFFRDLTEEQMKALENTVQLETEELFEVVKGMNSRGELTGTFLWWWYSRPLRTINLLQATPPTHMIYDNRHSLRAHFEAYEEYTKTKILVEDVEECPQLKPPKREPVKREEEDLLD